MSCSQRTEPAPSLRIPQRATDIRNGLRLGRAAAAKGSPVRLIVRGKAVLGGTRVSCEVTPIRIAVWIGAACI